MYKSKLFFKKIAASSFKISSFFHAFFCVLMMSSGQRGPVNLNDLVPRGLFLNCDWLRPRFACRPLLSLRRGGNLKATT